jgi:uncharacterized delta-60 repeat protein
LIPWATFALSPGDLDVSFTPGVPPDRGYNVAVPFTDGSILVFPTSRRGEIHQITRDGILQHFAPTNFLYGGPAVLPVAVEHDQSVLLQQFEEGKLLRLKPDGTVDPTFQPSFEGYGLTSRASVLPDGRIVVALSLRDPLDPSTNRYGLGRIFPDGSPDPSFVTSPGTRRIDQLAVQSDGAIVAMLSYFPEPEKLIRFHADGNLDVNYAPPVVQNRDYGYGLTALLITAEDQLYIAGSITNIGGEEWVGPARLNKDGSHDTSFVVKGWPSPPPRITGLNFLSDGELLIVSDTLRKVDQNGAPSTAWEATSPQSQEARLLTVTPDYIYFYSAIQYPELLRTLMRLFHDGRLDPSFTLKPFGGSIRGIHRSSDRLIAVGRDSSYILTTNGVPEREIYFLRNNFIHSSAMQHDGRVLVVSPTQRTLLRLNPDGILDSDFKAPEVSRVECILPRRNGKILVSGQFEVSGPPSRTNFIQLNADGSLDPSWPLNAWKANRTMVETAGEEIIFARYNLLRLKPDGSIDVTFERNNLWWYVSESTGPGATVEALLSLENGGFYAAGHFIGISQTNIFMAIPSVGRAGIARFHPTGLLDQEFIPELPYYTTLKCVARQPNGKILAADRYRLYRLLPTGRKDKTFKITEVDGEIGTIEIEPNGDILIGGEFTIVNGKSMPGIARLHGDAILESPDLTMRVGAVNLHFQVLGRPRPVLALEESTNLLSWKETFRTNFSGQIIITIPKPSVPQTFYRVFAEE